VPVVTYATDFRDFRREYAGDSRDYIDGEVIDVKEFDPPALPNERRGGFPGQPSWDGSS
jgi:UPF0716 protein FxsA